jgi:zinc protease
LSRVSAQDVLAAARKYLAPEQMIVVAVGERAKIVPQLQKLKLAPLEVRDTDGQLPRAQR